MLLVQNILISSVQREFSWNNTKINAPVFLKCTIKRFLDILLYPDVGRYQI